MFIKTVRGRTLSPSRFSLFLMETLHLPVGLKVGISHWEWTELEFRESLFQMETSAPHEVKSAHVIKSQTLELTCVQCADRQLWRCSREFSCGTNETRCCSPLPPASQSASLWSPAKADFLKPLYPEENRARTSNTYITNVSMAVRSTKKQLVFHALRKEKQSNHSCALVWRKTIRRKRAQRIPLLVHQWFAYRAEKAWRN